MLSYMEAQLTLSREKELLLAMCLTFLNMSCAEKSDIVAYIYVSD